MTSIRLSWAFALTVALLPVPASADLAIQHEPLDCVVAGAYTRIESRFTSVAARAHVYFRAQGTTAWYYVDMNVTPTGGVGFLPKVKPDVPRIEYYIDAIDRARGSGRTAEIAPQVVAHAADCKGRLAAVILAQPSIDVHVPVPTAALVGFEPDAVRVVAVDATDTVVDNPHHHKAWPIFAAGAVASVAIAAAGGDGGDSPAQAQPSAPSATINSVTPAGTALASATVVTFAAGGGAATYAWNFGDGGSGSGQTASHVFAGEGTFTVTLRATTGGREATATTVVAVKSLTGHWVEQSPGQDTHDLVQTGATLGGLFTAAAGKQVPLTGAVSDPRRVVYERTDCDRHWELTANDTLTQLTGVESHLAGCGIPDPSRGTDPIVLVRQ